MAEAFHRARQYDYAANSNLVLQSERERRGAEPSGEAENRWGAVATVMGDRATRRKP